ncbi:hypothetical protein HPP92_002009 [Vanilla planifolia]|uniref:J domain-containing protein n=1 Tax=Vanilla planifolia TaxID=51239 RepID=A0A835VHH3_VANPL|nr:hypothetical protein HPP92_002009 [Vanilla planifolia]
MGNPNAFYEVLGIPNNSSSDEIRKAYKALVKKWHPDKHPPSSKPEAEARFKSITQAYEALHVRDFNSSGAGSECGVGESICRRRTPLSPSMTTVPNAAVGSYSGKLPLMEKKLECTLEELFHGCKKTIFFKRDVVVDGVVLTREDAQTIVVKPGWKKGTKITFEGRGNERPGCRPADIVFFISEKDHPHFKRVGDDLVLKVHVPLVNSLTGWTFSFRLIGGEKTTISFRDEIIYPGYEKVIKGQGMPLVGQKGVRGDLRINFHVRFPHRLSDEQRSQIAKILNESS